MIEHLEVLVEEFSMEVALRAWIPRIVPGIGFDVHAFQGKPDLLKKLNSRLAGYRRWLPDSMGVVVIVDRDQQDCIALKQTLERAARDCGLRTNASAAGRRFQVLNRIAVEELEAWFLGDVNAICSAYPGVPTSLANRAGLRDPDAVRGGTAEALERVLKQSGHATGGMSKTSAARRIAPEMDVENNRSNSFCQFRDGLRRFVRQMEK